MTTKTRTYLVNGSTYSSNEILHRYILEQVTNDDEETAQQITEMLRPSFICTVSDLELSIRTKAFRVYDNDSQPVAVMKVKIIESWKPSKILVEAERPHSSDKAKAPLKMPKLGSVLSSFGSLFCIPPSQSLSNSFTQTMHGSTGSPKSPTLYRPLSPSGLSSAGMRSFKKSSRLDERKSSYALSAHS